MIPYSDFNFFILFGFALLPLVALTILWKSNKIINLLFSLLFIFIMFIRPQIVNPLGFFVIFMLYQYLLLYVIRRLKKKANRTRLGLFIFLAVFPLLIVKIYPLLTRNNLFLEQIFTFINITTPIGFLGISYVTFRSIQVLIDVNDGVISKINFLNYLYFVSFFPTIVSGPIDRYQRFMRDVEHPFNRTEYLSQLKFGLHRIAQGFFYKFIIAFLIKKYWLNIDLTDVAPIVKFFSQMYSYSFYLFFDFAGYSSFAIGASYMLGIKTPENFNKPFLSRNILDFWNRWHISLSTWFRDYVFMRIVLFIRRKKLLKNKKLASAIGFFCSFGLMGFWHGIELNYIIYGFYHGTVCAIYELFPKRIEKISVAKSTLTIKLIFSYIITFHIVCFSFWIFSGLGF